MSLCYHNNSTCDNWRVYGFRSEGLRVKTRPCSPMSTSLSLAVDKNHVNDDYQIENLPCGSGKGRCLWRQCKSTYGYTRSSQLPTKQESPIVRWGSPHLEAWGD